MRYTGDALPFHMPMNHQDEYLDIVNERDEVVGRKLRSEVYAEGRSDFRVVNVFLRNAEGRLWIPRRTATKRIFPLCLDMSMGGHVESGETYDEAFRRELSEELDMDAEAVAWSVLGNLNPAEHGVSAFMRVYLIETDDAPRYNPADFTEYFWLTPDEVCGRIESGDGAKSDLSKLVKIFYGG